MKPSWMVLNQSQSPVFQAMLEALCEEFGPTLLVTGTPFPSHSSLLRIRRGPKYWRRSVATRGISWLAFCLYTLWQLLWVRGRFALVTTNPPFLQHIATIIDVLVGFRFGVLVWDIYPEHAINQGWLSRNGLVAKSWFWANRASYRRAAVVITIGNRMAEELRSEMDESCSAPVIVIPNWSDTTSIHPRPKETNPFAIRYDQVEKLTVLYSGNLGKTHGVASLVEAASLLSEVAGLEFIIIGNGLGLTDVQERVRLYHAKNLKILPLQPWDMLQYSLPTGDIAVVLQEPGAQHLSVPSKVYGFMAAGCAIVAATETDSDLCRLVEDEGIGLVCRPGAPASLAAAISRLADDRELLFRCRSSARRGAELRFSPEPVRRAFIETLRSVAGMAK